MYHDQFLQEFPRLCPRHGQPQYLENQWQGVKVIDKTGIDKLIDLPRFPVRLGKRGEGAMLTIRLDPVRLIYFLTPFTINLRIIQAELEKIL